MVIGNDQPRSLNNYDRSSDASFINIQMFVQAAEAYLAYVPLAPMARDRYVDNEDKRGAKFLVGTTDRP